MKRLLNIPFVFMFLVLFAFSAEAAVKNYVVLPMNVDTPPAFKGLEKSVPEMFNSRLNWPGNFEPSAKSSAVDNLTSTQQDAEKALSLTGAEYAVWGSIKIVGDNATINMNVTGKNGSKWSRERNTKITQIIPAFSALSESISSEVFKRSGTGAVVVQDAQTRQPVAENTEYMNPSIRYGEQQDSTRLRSQHLNFEARGMEVCDADGDGKNEIFIMDDKYLYAYVWNNGKLVQLAKQQISKLFYNVSLRSFDFDNNGKPSLIVTTVDNKNMPRTNIYSFNGKEFKAEVSDARYYVNVIRDPVTGRQILLGQLGDPYSVFKRGPAVELVKNGNKLEEFTTFPLGQFLNIYNYVIIPSNPMDPTSVDLIAYIHDNDKLRITTTSGSILSETAEMYNGSTTGVETIDVKPGMAKSKNDTVNNLYYIPTRMILADLNSDGQYELIISRPNTVAGSLFKRYRSFQQSEVQSIYWDGVGMGIQWKTRVLQGSIVDIALADLGNDGRLNLVMLATVGSSLDPTRKSIIVGYPLDLSKVNNIDSDLVSGDFGN